MIRKHAILLDPAPASAPAASAGGGGASPSPSPTPSSPAPAQGGASPDKPSAPASDPGDPFASIDTKGKPRTKEPAPDPNKAEGGDKDKGQEPKDRQITANSPKALREAHERATKRVAELESQIAQLSSKAERADAAGKDITALTGRIEELQKQLQAREGDLRMAKQEMSPEFKQKYEKPFTDAADFAEELIKSLRVKEGDPDNPTQRAGTANDLVRLYNLPPSEANAVARAMFGEDAPMVIQQLIALRQLDRAKAKALQEERENFKKKNDEDTANHTAQIEHANRLWKETKQGMLDAHPEWQADPRDAAEKAILEKSYSIVGANENGALAGKTMEQLAKHNASIFHRAATQPLYVYRYNQAKERIAELEAELAERKGGGPGSTRNPGGGSTTDANGKSWKSELREAMS